MNLKTINGHRVGTPDALPYRDRYGAVRSATEKGLRPLYLTRDVQAGVYEDRSGHKWTWNAQVGWVLTSDGRYLRQCCRATLARRYGLTDPKFF